mmetsp:Transcript_11331/g.21739  ORF Transcript_11331/g.21739 Transcript_11331/m.21739 type:complete len:275 (-) Transcript_11331:491-1315(-)
MLEEACMRRIVKPKRLMMFRMISYDRYAACCMEFDIDGAIMAEANVDLLVELGFIKIHAHKVVQSIKKLTQSDSPQPCVSMILPLTEKEGKRMMKFGELYEVITEGEKKAMEALTRVTEEKKAARQQAKKIFTLLKEKVEAEELRCIAAIEKDHSTICAGLNKIIDQLRTNRLESKAKEKEINAASRISDWSQQKERMVRIMTESEKVLRKTQPMLGNQPSIKLSLEAIDSFLKANTFSMASVRETVTTDSRVLPVFCHCGSPAATRTTGRISR